jgi:hypothetical protein
MHTSYWTDRLHVCDVADRGMYGPCCTLLRLGKASGILRQVGQAREAQCCAQVHHAGGVRMVRSAATPGCAVR